jgi:hypothetical protein
MGVRTLALTGSRIAAAACLVLLAALIGCGDKETAPPDQVESAFLPRTSPQNLLHNLKQAYLERNAAEYESLLAVDFTFLLSEEDQAKPDMPDDWGLETECLIHRHMFDDGYVQQASLDFTVGNDLTWDAVQGMYTMMITNVDLFLYGSTPAHPTELKEYKVSDGRAKFWFRKNPWTTGAAHDSVWTIVMCEDNPTGSRGSTGSALSEAASWGSIKALYR